MTHGGGEVHATAIVQVWNQKHCHTEGPMFPHQLYTEFLGKLRS